MVNRTTFAKVWSAAINACCSPAFVMNAFAKSGLVPFNPQAIDRSQLKPSFKRTHIGDGVDATADNGPDAPEPLVCPTCGHLERPHPIVAVRQLPVELRPVFSAAEVIHESEVERPIRRRATIDKGRLLTSDEWYEIIKKKEEEQIKMKEDTEKRKQARIEKRKMKEETEKEKQLKKQQTAKKPQTGKKEQTAKKQQAAKKQQTTKKQQASKKQQTAKKQNSNQESTAQADSGHPEQGHHLEVMPDPAVPSTSTGVVDPDPRCSYITYEQYSDDEDVKICAICSNHNPPEDVLGEIAWIQCTMCLSWFHFVCLGVFEKLHIDVFICSKCI